MLRRGGGGGGHGEEEARKAERGIGEMSCLVDAVKRHMKEEGDHFIPSSSSLFLEGSPPTLGLTNEGCHGSLLNIQLFNSFHSDATEPSVSALLSFLHGSDQSTASY